MGAKLLFMHDFVFAQMPNSSFTPVYEMPHPLYSSKGEVRMESIQTEGACHPVALRFEKVASIPRLLSAQWLSSKWI